MFDFDCPECGKRRLIFPSQIKHLVNDDHGIAIIFTCWCGALGAIRTGNVALDALAPVRFIDFGCGKVNITCKPALAAERAERGPCR